MKLESISELDGARVSQRRAEGASGSQKDLEEVRSSQSKVELARGSRRVNKRDLPKTFPFD